MTGPWLLGVCVLWGRPRWGPVLVVDLFCGAGGASAGLAELPGANVVGFDVWPVAVDTHNANGLVAHLHDLSDPAGDHLIPSCDVMWMSPPCQPFSAASDGAGVFDDRDGFPWCLRIIGRLLPPVVLFENVKGLTFAGHRPYFAGILRSLERMGYATDWCVLNTADYGVPQTRERCIVVGRHDSGRIVWPMPTHSKTVGLFTEPWVTMADALGWAGELSYQRGEGMRARHGERGPWDTAEIPSPTIHRNSFKDARVTLVPGAQRRATVRTLDECAPTVAFGNDMARWSWKTPEKSDVRLSIAELACLQGFPDGWVWTGGITDNARMIGNACPPALARVVAASNLPV